MNVGHAILYDDGELVISKNHTLLQKRIIKDYGEFDDRNVPWKKELDQIKKVQILEQVKVNYLKSWFEYCINLKTLINFQNLDTSVCTDFSCMFACCESLQTLTELENWNVSNGTDFSCMFSCCKLLQKISLSNTLDILSKNIFLNCNLNLKIKWKNHTYTYSDLLEYEQIS